MSSGIGERMKLRDLVAHWKAESKRVKELADKQRSKSGCETLTAQSVRYWMCASELEAALALAMTDEAPQKLPAAAVEREGARPTFDEWWETYNAWLRAENRIELRKEAAKAAWKAALERTAQSPVASAREAK